MIPVDTRRIEFRRQEIEGEPAEQAFPDEVFSPLSANLSIFEIISFAIAILFSHRSTRIEQKGERRRAKDENIDARFFRL
jgi:hypothetical protein